ncbi:hypothetical protein V474_13565 [Novosphingobium barchaimii LL02]|uniref:Uncharacterized protein n=1 Tax=Novosphingobium barchaimii LL02 TaxID=1114963 RepID=A0A0J7XYJ4_9SPHN|nr:hypothetical protein V474_13565 [Novosphingobium barchaimii LL02]
MLVAYDVVNGRFAKGRPGYLDWIASQQSSVEPASLVIRMT